jgi:hypothetical protein
MFLGLQPPVFPGVDEIVADNFFLSFFSGVLGTLLRILVGPTPMWRSLFSESGRFPFFDRFLQKTPVFVFSMHIFRHRPSAIQRRPVMSVSAPPKAVQ